MFSKRAAFPGALGLSSNFPEGDRVLDKQRQHQPFGDSVLYFVFVQSPSATKLLANVLQRLFPSPCANSTDNSPAFFSTQQ